MMTSQPPRRIILPLPLRTTIQRLRLDSFLSFAPGSEAIELEPLNVLIGPNGAGKSNVIEAVELLHATPANLAAAIRDGGGPQEWLWKGQGPGRQAATIDVVLDTDTPTYRPLRYRLENSQNGDEADRAVRQARRRYRRAKARFVQIELDGAAGNAGRHPFIAGKEPRQQVIESAAVPVLDLIQHQRQVARIVEQSVFRVVCPLWLPQRRITAERPFPERLHGAEALADPILARPLPGWAGARVMG